MQCWQDCKLVQQFWETVWRFPKKLKIIIPYDLPIPILNIYPKKLKTLIKNDTQTFMFITVLFTIAKIWKQPR